MAEAVEADSPTTVGNDELVENCLIMIQQLFAEEQISGQERDHLKGNFSFKIKLSLANTMQKFLRERLFVFCLFFCGSHLTTFIFF